MTRSRINPAQLRAQLRQAQQKQRQAINRGNAPIRKLKQAVDSYKQGPRTTRLVEPALHIRVST